MNKELWLWAVYFLVCVIQGVVIWFLSKKICHNFIIRVFFIIVSLYVTSLIMLGMNALPNFIAYLCLVAMNLGALAGVVLIPVILVLGILWVLIPKFRKSIGNWLSK